MTAKELTFGRLVDSIQQVHGEMAAQASKAVNISLTLRNWIIGYYIREYEQNGADRADYGDRLIDELATQLQAKGMKRCDRRELYRYRIFYNTYPQIVESATPQLLSIDSEILTKVESATPKLMVPGRKLVEKLSFTHLAELIKIENNLKRTFYEVECPRVCAGGAGVGSRPENGVTRTRIKRSCFEL